MTQSDEEALDPELLALLRAENAPASREVKERVASRLAQSVGAVMLNRAPSASPAAAGHPVRSLLAALRVQPLGFTASFLLGSAFGVGAYAALQRARPVQIVFVDRPGFAPAVIASAVAAEPESQGSAAHRETEPTPSSAGSNAPTSAARSASASLAEQQALLDVARQAFARNDSAATLAALNAHFRRYPKSMLGEERAALEIKALAASERRSEAMTRAVRFKAQYPQSLLLPSVQDSVGEIP